MADQQFLEFVINYRSQNKILVITLDNDLINDILMENELESYSGNTITVMKITDDGFLNEVNSMPKNRRAESHGKVDYLKMFNLDNINTDNN